MPTETTSSSHGGTGAGQAREYQSRYTAQSIERMFQIRGQGDGALTNAQISQRRSAIANVTGRSLAAVETYMAFDPSPERDALIDAELRNFREAVGCINLGLLTGGTTGGSVGTGG